MNLGNTIKNIRKKNKLTQKELARNAKITQTYLSLVEKDWRRPSINVLDSIAKALGVSTPFLIFYSIDDNDVPEDKKLMYKILHPHMKQMVDEIVFDKTTY